MKKTSTTKRTNTTKRANTTKKADTREKKDIYQQVTDRMIAKLNEGVIPWVRPWTGNPYAYSTESEKQYSPLNQMLLSHLGAYGTFKAWQAKGGKIRKGEKAEYIVFWKWMDKTVKDENGNEKREAYPVLREYPVFHYTQVEGIDISEYEAKVHTDGLAKPIHEADAVINDYTTRENIALGFNGGRSSSGNGAAKYNPAFDRIEVPSIEAYPYNMAEEYYSTVYHEMVHSTGAAHRLNRLDPTAKFGSEVYSREELVAEMGAAMLCSIVGIETKSTFGNSAAYIQGWAKYLKDDPKAFIWAASRAEKAVKFILGDEEVTEEKATEEKATIEADAAEIVARATPTEEIHETEEIATEEIATEEKATEEIATEESVTEESVTEEIATEESLDPIAAVINKVMSIFDKE